MLVTVSFRSIYEMGFSMGKADMLMWATKNVISGIYTYMNGTYVTYDMGIHTSNGFPVLHDMKKETL
jgi:hypothetical protein